MCNHSKKNPPTRANATTPASKKWGLAFQEWVFSKLGFFCYDFVYDSAFVLKE